MRKIAALRVHRGKASETPPVFVRPGNRPVVVGFSTDRLVDSLTDVEAWELTKLLGNHASPVALPDNSELPSVSYERQKRNKRFTELMGTAMQDADEAAESHLEKKQEARAGR